MTAPDPFRLDGRRALITGASRGIGRAIAESYAQAGARLALAARTTANLEQVASEVRDHGAEVHTFSADLTDAQAPTHLVEDAAEALGGLDIVVNNAGDGGHDGLTLDAYRRLLHVNLRAPVLIIQAARIYLLESNAPVVINVSSVSAKLGGAEPYGPLKAALSSYTVGLAREWGKDGIRVVAIAPGVIETDMTASYTNADWWTGNLSERVSLGRNGQVEEIAGVARFLASDAAAYITGAVISVDGGWVHQF
ncbi:MAG: SDR family NAD(P)-dependent oxidoreductase [Chloroflexota bacterium]|nr:SDR family NAD(P)-dependent oxidoreductase [Chloroflexota bacterium]MDE2919844.1 SDR family NAD(P)-dependent oxidoreductase [Chloroflexota bacterium]